MWRTFSGCHCLWRPKLAFDSQHLFFLWIQHKCLSRETGKRRLKTRIPQMKCSHSINDGTVWCSFSEQTVLLQFCRLGTFLLLFGMIPLRVSSKAIQPTLSREMMMNNFAQSSFLRIDSFSTELLRTTCARKLRGSAASTWCPIHSLCFFGWKMASATHSPKDKTWKKWVVLTHFILCHSVSPSRSSSP